MENIIEIEDLTFKYENEEVFNNLNLSITKNSFTTILGPNGSGKTTLIKLIIGLLKSNTYIMIENTPIIKENFDIVREDIAVLFDNHEDNFVTQSPQEELSFTLENLNIKQEEIEEKINKITKQLEIQDILNEELENLNDEEKTLVALASALIRNPKILLIDGILENLSKKKKQIVFKLLKEQQQLTIINATNEIEDSLIGDEIIILNNKIAQAKGKTKDILDEDIFKSCNLELPFIIELSNKLKFYNLISNTYLDEEKLVEDLWK